MVRAEDKQFEQQVLESGNDIAVPFELSLFQDKTLDILAYSFCVKIAEEFEEKYASEPLSGEALDFLYEKITPLMEARGYSCKGALGRIHMEFIGVAPDETRILPDCELISSLDDEEWEDELELEEFGLDADNPADRMAVIRRDGKIVCYCGLNDISEDDGGLELTVECAEDYRWQGFGSSCVAKLTRYLLDRGERVKYVCALSNQLSFRTAAAAGLTPHREILPFVCYKKFELDGEEIELKF